MGHLKYLFGMKGRSGWGSGTKAESIADANRDLITDKVFIITGCNSGIGLETARVICKSGGHVVMACRKEEAMAAAIQTIRSVHPNARVTPIPCDLSSKASVMEFSRRFLESGLKLDVLVNNAGIMACPHRLTVDGNESQFGTNHLGHFLLTELLREKLEQDGGGRVVNLASVAHNNAYKDGGIHFDDITGERVYTEWGAYGQSKLANIIHAKSLEKRWAEKGANVHAYSLHPGVIVTPLWKHTLGKVAGSVAGALMTPFWKNVPQGAATTVFVATTPSEKLTGGGYYYDCNEGRVGRVEAENEEIASRLWELSARLMLS